MASDKTVLLLVLVAVALTLWYVRKNSFSIGMSRSGGKGSTGHSTVWGDIFGVEGSQVDPKLLYSAGKLQQEEDAEVRKDIADAYGFFKGNPSGSGQFGLSSSTLPKKFNSKAFSESFDASININNGANPYLMEDVSRQMVTTLKPINPPYGDDQRDDIPIRASNPPVSRVSSNLLSYGDYKTPN